MNHPLNPDAITDDNYRDIAHELFREQLVHNVDYSRSLIEHPYSDDDTDYFRTNLNALETLMDISYDGSRQDLIDFLFMSRRDYELLADPTTSDRPRPLHEPLHYIDSAGGLCDALMSYSEINYRKEEADNA